VKSEQDVEGERRKRIELEGKLLKMKEELARRDKDKAEVQYRMGAIENDLQDYRADNERLKRDLEAAAEAYTHRIAELETQLTTEDQQHRETIEKYNEEFEKFKK
jgi:chromosome segregation ATPase